VPRKLRMEYAGAIYHVINRGDRREDIFRDQEDRQCFLSTLGEACQKTRWQVHAYCLMRNHFDVYVKAPKERPFWLRVNRLPGEKGIPRDSAAGRRELARQMELRREPLAAKRFGAAGVWGARNFGGSRWRPRRTGLGAIITGGTVLRAAKRQPGG